MNKRAYIFYLLIFIFGFSLCYFVGYKVGSNTKMANTKVTESKESEKKVSGYWIKAVNDTIFVFEKDGKTVVAQTDINISFLSEKEKALLSDGIYFETAEDLFKYLESNTS